MCTRFSRKIFVVARFPEVSNRPSQMETHNRMVALASERMELVRTIRLKRYDGQALEAIGEETILSTLVLR